MERSPAALMIRTSWPSCCAASIVFSSVVTTPLICGRQASDTMAILMAVLVAHWGLNEED
jgi:hypothetical protein